MNDQRPHVVILGAGFGGIYAARALSGAAVRVTIVDRRNHHLFQPLLYQVATAELNPSDIAAPVRAILRGSEQTTVLLGEVTRIDVEQRQVHLEDGVLSYDSLIVATGATHSFFGNDEWAQYTLGLKTLEDALEIRRRVLLAFERAERESDPAERQKWLTFVIIGAGPTGVELAGALAEISRKAIAKDFRNIDPRKARVILVEGMEQVLPTYPERLGERGRRSLERLGVEVMTGSRVTSVVEDGIELQDQRIAARTVLWAAGVAASPVARSLGAPLDRAGRVKVTSSLTVPGREEVFVIGDLASFEQDGAPVPGVAPAAMQQGKHVAENLRRKLEGKPLLPFRYWDRGTFAVIGRGKAVGVAFRRFQLSGFSAWLTWLFVHILFLIGFRNRLVVLINWGYSFFTSKRGIGLITGAVPSLQVEAPRSSKPPLRAQG